MLHSSPPPALSLSGRGPFLSVLDVVPILMEADPDMGKLVVADRDPEQITAIRNILLKRGKEGLLEVVSSKDSTDAGGSYVEREDEMGKPYVLYAPCDILIPVAVGNVINPTNVPLLNCRLIVPIANNVYSDNDAVPLRCGSAALSTWLRTTSTGVVRSRLPANSTATTKITSVRALRNGLAPHF